MKLNRAKLPSLYGSVTSAFILAIVAVGLFTAVPAFATVDSGEIVADSLSATVSQTYDPVNGYSVTFQWTTLHPGNSVVIIENSNDYNSNNNVPTRQIIQNDVTTNHVVTVDHFPAYTPYATWGYYVGSKVGLRYCSARQPLCWVWATYPGPAVNGAQYATFTLPTEPTNPDGPLVWTMWPAGPQNVYQGDPTQTPACTPNSKSSRECNDLHVPLQPNLLSGPIDRQVQMQNALITNVDTRRPVSDGSITVHYECGFNMPSNPPPSDWDGSYSATETCFNGTIYSTNTTLRLRVNSQAVPGHYQFTGIFQAMYAGVNYGDPVPVTYNFTVLPTATFTATAPTSFPAIPNISNWKSNMVSSFARSAEFWCTNNTDTNPWWSLDNGNFTGHFDLPSSNYFEAWNYDGGRVYQQVADYSYNTQGLPDRGYHNDQQRDHWKRCAQLAMDPYRNMLPGTLGGFVREPNQFAFGMEMNYLRTGDPNDQVGVDTLAHAPAWNLFFSGNALPSAVRLSGYMMDSRLAAEIDGEPRDTTIMLRSVDVMLGYLDESYNLDLHNPNQQSYDVHPFLLATSMEALITYYELDLAEGNTPDARIPLEIKKTLDWLTATQFMPQTHALAYNVYDLPWDPQKVPGGLFGATELNDLVAPAYAWYWSKTNDSRYLTQGDDLFSHVFDSGGWTWSVKEFNQVYKWSFDYVRWRSGQNPDGSVPAVETVMAASNPCENDSNPCNAPWTDYTTPVSFSWVPPSNGGFPIINPNTVNSPTVTATTATFTFQVFKPNTSATIFYGLTAPTPCDLNNPQPPNCMQPFPDFGFLNMLNANYTNQSDPGVEVQDPAALAVGVTNIYDETITITGLTPNTTYHWRPLTTDASGNMAAFFDQTFTTAAE